MLLQLLKQPIFVTRKKEKNINFYKHQEEEQNFAVMNDKYKLLSKRLVAKLLDKHRNRSIIYLRKIQSIRLLSCHLSQR